LKEYSARYYLELNPIRVERKRRGWSQARLSRELRCTPHLIARLETSTNTELKVRFAMELGRAFGVSWVGLATAWIEWTDIIGSDPADIMDAFLDERETK